MMIKNDEELLKKLIDDDDDDDEFDNIELQKKKASLSSSSASGIINLSQYSKKQKQQNKKAGCPCWCKCIGFTVLAFSLLCLMVTAYVYCCFKDVVEHLTVATDTPRKFPVVEMSDSELEQVVDRVSSFIDEILNNYDGLDDDDEYAVPTTPIIEDLVLTQDEINGFLGHSDYLRGNAMVSLHKDRIVEEYSLPMDVLGFSDRYFVGNDYLALKQGEGESGGSDNNILEMKMETEATHEDWFDGPLFFAKLQYLVTTKSKDHNETGHNYILEMFLREGSFFGQVVPQEFIDKRQDLMEGLYDADDDHVGTILDVIEGIERVSIQEGKVIVKARQYS